MGVVGVTISKADLGSLTPIAEGSYGKVFSADDYHLADDATPLAYKEFTTEHASQAASAAAAVAFRDGLTSDEQAQLDLFSVWPRALVTESPGNVCGLLMPLLPEEFFCRLIVDESGLLVSRPREMKWLIARKKSLEETQIDLPEVDEAERLFLMAHLAYAIGWLHKRRWVVGDLSFKNVAFAVGPPQLKLLDCDAAAALANEERKQASTPFWGPPECEGTQPLLQDDITDVYKLGLAILRCLTPGNGAATSRNPGRLQSKLNSRGRGLVARALSANRDDRPTAKDLFSYLRGVASPFVALPRVTHAALAASFRLRGQHVRIDWQLAGAVDIAITVGESFREDVKYADNRKGCEIAPDESGQASIIVSNKYGSVTVGLGELTIYALPSFTVDLSHLPDPQVPAVEAFSMGPLSAVLGVDPSVRVTFPRVPDARSPEVPELVESLEPDVSPAIPGPHIDGTVIDVSNAIKSLIADEGERLVAALRQQVPGGGDG
jgi:hypothetical protein